MFPILGTASSLPPSPPNHWRPSTRPFLLFLGTLYIILTLPSQSSAYLKFSEQSCSDLVPRNIDQYNNNSPDNPNNNNHPQDFAQFFGFDTWTGSRGRYRQTSKRKRSGTSYSDEPPFKLTVTQRRYRRNANLIVQLEGGDFDGLMLQSRVVAGGEVLRGGVGLIGQFRYLPYFFEYLPCFGLPYATVVDKGRPVKLGNTSFIWTAPDAEAGDIRFLASVLSGIHYWIIVSNVLSFNPFPISTYSCGSSMACFRACSYTSYPCTASEALIIFSYSVDFRDKREIEFTLGGRISTSRATYIAVAFGNDFHKLIQADMTVCYLDHGRAKLEHLLIENLHLRPYQHNEVIELDDFDVDGEMLWCRFRRPININPLSIINPRIPVYHFYFRGNIDVYQQRFILPPRNQIYTSQFKRNFSTPVNEIISGSPGKNHFLSHFHLILGMSVLMSSFIHLIK